jgi:3-hydroxyacyl-CoA dehydrogenase/enoyl-CoA hydratase/3-hydroxybutyryl-CoA epimerase
VVVKDVAGFLVNRILLRYLNEAMYLLQENVPVLAIDNIIEEFGLPMGPCTLADTVGLDIGAKVASSLQQAYGERMQVALLLNVLQEKKILGQKAGAGFYLYVNNIKNQVNPQIISILQEIKLQLPKYEQKIDKQIIINRCIYSMINEASKCLEENVVENAKYLDLAMIFGTGFPAFRGGLLKYADSVGIVKIVETLQQLEKIYGNRFAVSDLLLTMSKNNTSFYQ